MKRAIARASLALGVISASACAPAVCPSTPLVTAIDRAAITSAVARELDDFHDAAAKADEERYFAHFARGGIFLGTDQTEHWDVAAFRAYAHPHFAKGKAWTMRATRRTITVSDDGRAAWFDEDLATEKLGPARGSGVLVSEDGAWKVAQYNLAITVPNERFGDVKALLEAKP
jgi:hypothetical protein